MILRSQHTPENLAVFLEEVLLDRLPPLGVLVVARLLRRTVLVVRIRHQQVDPLGLGLGLGLGLVVRIRHQQVDPLQGGRV